MKRILVLMGMLLALGCGDLATRHVIVVPVNEQDLLDGKALLLVNANAEGVQVKTPEVDDKKPAKCLCGGTGRSGDGLGPCACPDGCACKTARSEVKDEEEVPDVEQDAEPVTEPEIQAASEEEVPSPKDAEAPEVKETAEAKDPEPVKAGESGEFAEDENLRDIERVVGLIEGLTNNQVNITVKMADFESRLQVLEKPVVKAAAPEKPKVSGFTESQAKAAKLVFVSQDSCPPCRNMINNVFPELERRGWLVANSSSGWKTESGAEAQIQIIKIGELPSTSEAAETMKWVKETPFLGYFLNGKLITTGTGEWSADLIEKKLNEISGTITKPQAAATPPVYQYQRQIKSRLPVVKTPWGQIDLETYQRNCNCQMCKGIRSLQQQFRNDLSFTTAQPVSAVQPVLAVQAVSAAQAPSTDVVVAQVIKELSLTENDVFADIGCGDGRILIEAVKASGCKAVGIEIDPERAKLARIRVAEAGLSDSITVLTGDARQFDPAKYNVTAAVAYLYPQLLGELRPMLSRIERLATPFHQVPGMHMNRAGDVWLKTEGSVDGMKET